MASTCFQIKLLKSPKVSETNNLKKVQGWFHGKGSIFSNISKGAAFLLQGMFETDPVATVLNCNVSCHRVSLKHTLKKKGRTFRNIGKHTSLTVKSALHFF